jgi:hypothetical protein
VIYGIEDYGLKVQISFVTDEKPTQKNIKKIEKLFESTEKEKSLSSYYRNVNFIGAEVVIEEV